MPPATALILFDIDGTLIRRAGPHHRQVLVDAVRRVTGLDTTTDHIPVHGMLDPDILRRMMPKRRRVSPRDPPFPAGNYGPGPKAICPPLSGSAAEDLSRRTQDFCID